MNKKSFTHKCGELLAIAKPHLMRTRYEDSELGYCIEDRRCNGGQTVCCHIDPVLISIIASHLFVGV